MTIYTPLDRHLIHKMNILIIACGYPMPDCSSGELRFFTLLTLLARKHPVVYCALNDNGSVQQPNEASARLEHSGIALGEESLANVLQRFKPAVIWFEGYYQVRPDYLALLERCCPRARIVIDSIDVHYNRFEALARLTGKSEDVAAASDVKTRELAAYASADMVIAVSEDDKRLLQRELPNTQIEVIPNIHAVPAFPGHKRRRHGELVFVGGFKHSPNVDAMHYFCRDVMPLITAACPESRLKIIGSNPPQDVHALANAHIEVLGYVPETAPHLESAYISVAPLRYGGGMKGKVGEAMSYGLPVVTTSFGAEGFGLQPGRDLLVGDSAVAFAAQVIALLNNTDLHALIARRGYDFIRRNYSVPVVERMFESSMRKLAQMPPRRIPLIQRITIPSRNLLARHFAWRLSQ